jgi:S1-C subfamily serine protease
MSFLASFPGTPRNRRTSRAGSAGARGIAGSRHPGSWYALAAFVTGIIGASTASPEEPARGPDVVRPTVQIRNGDRRGSATVIASIPDETWILTAAHVVEKPSQLRVELHRFNFGSRLTGLTEGGGWPRLVPATVAATDPDADVALVRIRGMTALPSVARLDPEAAEPAKGEVMTSVGIDRGLHLTSWQTTIEGTAMVDLGKGGGARRFTVTTKPPEHGRSGGGLFRKDGAVVGVCTGFFELKPGQHRGVFGSVASIRQVLRGQGIEKSVRPPAHQP